MMIKSKEIQVKYLAVETIHICSNKVSYVVDVVHRNMIETIFGVLWPLAKLVLALTKR